MKKLFFACVALIFFTITCEAQQPINLKFNLQKGESYDYALNMDIGTTGDVAGQNIDVKNTIGINYHFTNVGDSAGWKKLNSTITRIVMNVNVGGMNISYDSDAAADTNNMVNASLGKVLGAMKGGQFNFTVNESGEIGSVSGFDGMMQKMQSAASGMPGAGNIGNAFNEQNFKQNIQQAFGAYPGKAVKPGDTWAATMDINSGGVPMKTESMYTLESVSGNTANVKVNATLSSPVGDSSMSINGTTTGTMQFDIPSGIAVNGDVDTKLDMNMTRQGQAMPMKTIIKMKITGKKS